MNDDSSLYGKKTKLTPVTVRQRQMTDAQLFLHYQFQVTVVFFYHRLAFERALSLDHLCTGAMTGLAILELNSKKVRRH